MPAPRAAAVCARGRPAPRAAPVDARPAADRRADRAAQLPRRDGVSRANLLAGACGSYGIARGHLEPGEAGAARRASRHETSRSGTRPSSATTARRSSSPTSGAAARRRCVRPTRMMEMGGNTILTRRREEEVHAARLLQDSRRRRRREENCVSHNGGLIPVPGRDIMVQGWYQGGVSVMDFTDPDQPMELAYFDRGSIDPPPGVDVPQSPPAPPAVAARGTIGGSWGAYYWNGLHLLVGAGPRLRHPRADAERRSCRRTRSTRRSS